MKHVETRVRLLLGGGIGSGKSAVGQRLQELGGMIVDADRLGHAVLGHDGEVLDRVIERWPSALVEGQIDRSILAGIVFTDPEQLLELERITHPAIVNRITEIASSAEELVVEIPVNLDVPGNWIRIFVDTSEDVRLRRAVERGNSEADVRRRMANQPTRDEWLTWCDKTIDNNGSVEELERQVNAVWYELRTANDGLQP